MLPRLLLIAFLLASAPAAAKDAAPAGEPSLPLLSLNEALAEALAHSPVLKISAEKLAQANMQVKKAYALLLPFVSVQGSYTRADEEIGLDFGSFGDLFTLAMMNCGNWDETTMGPLPEMCAAPPPADDSSDDESSARVIQELNNFDAGVTVGMSLLNLRTWPLIKNVYTAEEITQLQASFSREQLAYTVVQLYYGVATAQSAVALMKENLGTVMRHLDLTEIRFKAGVALQNERVRAAMGVVQARNSLDQAVLALENSKDALAVLLGRTDLAFVVEEIPAHPWEALAPGGVDTKSLAGRKDILVLDKVRLMTERGLTDVRFKFLPTLRGAWNWSWSSNMGFAGRHTQWRALVTLNWSLFEGGSRWVELDEARSKIREAGFNRDLALQHAEVEARSTYNQIRSARRDVQAATENLELAKENLEIVEKQYKLGAAPQTAIIDAELQYRSARIQTLVSRLRVSLAEIAYVRAVGRLSLEGF